VDVLGWLYTWLFRSIACLYQSSSIVKPESIVGR
jgi:hypothetical protein